ncbi:MAG: nucleotide exchange factor GrpE [Treponema sp.]|nr:nucleotide exchange factor GrpE [Spirochaetia bacterium]MDD7460604.1 nucleotide exchange factor GrpE [Spirochaetales bacterium]MDY5811161.1 nucleotide exchange factor GrpE [Treponema sp.]MDY5919239.1 nucleotide exchange factor GrpE [Treponema sp.]
MSKEEKKNQKEEKSSELKNEATKGAETKEEKAAEKNQSEKAENNEAAANESSSKEDAPKEVTPEEKIAALEAENAELKEEVKRRMADFENYRKRAIQEKQDAFDYANTSLLKDLLESLDNFDRTVEAAATATDPKSIADGVSMINKSLISMLENKYGLIAYGAAGEAFNPDLHEAIGKADEDVAEPTLKAVYLKGYKLKDRVIRHAKVMVSMPKEGN